MLDCSATNLRDEVEACVLKRKKRTDQAREIIAAYRGEPTVGGDGKVLESYENLAWEFTQIVGAKLMYSNPVVNIDMGGVTSPQTIAMTAAMNSNIKAVNLVRKLRRIRLDMMLSGYGCAEVYLERVPGWDAQRDQLDLSNPASADTGPALRPNVARVSPVHMALDWAAQHWEESRMFVKLFARDRDDLAAARNPMTGQPLFDEAVLKACSLDAGWDEMRRELVSDGFDLSTLSRKTIIGYEIFVPESGLIYTIPFLPISVGDGYLRAPRKYAGPASGPFVIFGIAEEPEQPYPISPLKPMMPLMREINSHAAKISRDAAKSKWAHFMDGTDVGLADKIAAGDDNAFWVIPGLAGKVVQSVEIGGMSDHEVVYLDRIRSRGDRQLGLSDAVKGQPQSGKTASADVIAERSFDIRIQDTQGLMRELVTSVLTKMADFMWSNPRVKYVTPYTDPQTKQSRMMMFEGGVRPGEDPSAFHAMSIGIQPYSMEPVDQAVLQRREVDKLTILSAQLPPPVDAPLVWEQLLNDYGEAFNQKGLGTRLMQLLGQDKQAMMQQAAMIAAAQQAAGQEPGGEGGGGLGGGPQPRKPAVGGGKTTENRLRIAAGAA